MTQICCCNDPIYAIMGIEDWEPMVCVCDRMIAKNDLEGKEVHVVHNSKKKDSGRVDVSAMIADEVARWARKSQPSRLYRAVDAGFNVKVHAHSDRTMIAKMTYPPEMPDNETFSTIGEAYTVEDAVSAAESKAGRLIILHWKSIPEEARRQVAKAICLCEAERRRA